MISVEMGTIEMSGQKCCGLIGTYRLMTWIGFNCEKCDSETHGYTVGVGGKTNQNYVFSRGHWRTTIVRWAFPLFPIRQLADAHYIFRPI